MKFSQRLSVDRLVLELRQDERGFDDVADRGGAEADALDGPPPLGHQREAAFALVAQGSLQRVAGFGIDIEFAAARFPHRHVDARAGPFIAGIGEEGQVLQVGAGPGQDQPGGQRSGRACCPAARPRPTAGTVGSRPGLRGLLVSYLLAASLRCQASSVAGVTGKTQAQRLRGRSRASAANYTRSAGS